MGQQGILDVLNDIRGISPIIRCGSGSYGEVWLCRDSVGRTIALKIVSKTLLGESWEREFQGLKAYCRKIQGHPNLLNMYQIFDAGDYFCYTMEAADDFNCGNGAYMADTLSYRLKRGRMELDDLEILMTGLLDGLETLHCAGLTHRDIKPGNILIVNTYPKIADIGLVTALDRSYSMSLVGTPGFIPREALTEKYDGVQHDLYATAKVLYCAITGNPVDRFPYFPPELLENGVYRKLNRFLLRACSDQIQLRYRSASEFRQDFNRCINNRNEHLHSRFYRISRGTVIKHRGLIALSLISGVMFGLGFLFFLLTEKDWVPPPENTPQVSVAPPVIQTPISQPEPSKPVEPSLPRPAPPPVSAPHAEPPVSEPTQSPAPVKPPAKPPAAKTVPTKVIVVDKSEKKSSMANRIARNEQRLAELEREAVSQEARMTQKQKSLLNSKIAFRKQQAQDLAKQKAYLDKVKAAKKQTYNEELNRRFYELVKQYTSPRSNQDNQQLEGQILGRLRSGSINPNIIVTDVANPANSGPLLGLVLNKRWSQSDTFLMTLRQLYVDSAPFVYQSDEYYRQFLSSGLDELEPNKSMLLPALASNWELEAKLLIYYGAEVNTADRSGKTPLHLAAERNFTEILNLLVFADAEINAVDNRGNTPYIWAMQTGNSQSVELLEQAGADVQHLNRAGKKGRDYLNQGKFYQAILKQDITLLQEAIKDGVNLYQLFSDRLNALQKASSLGNAEMVETLLAAHFNPERKLEPGTVTPLEIALNAGNIKAFKALLYGGVDSRETKSSSSLLSQACRKGRAGDEFIRILLAEGKYNINPTSSYEAPLVRYLDGKNPNPDIVKALINAGANVHSKQQNGTEAPLNTAIQQKHSPRILKILIDAGADVNSYYNNGRTRYSLLMFALKQQLPNESIKLLLESGADASFVAEDGKKARDLTNDRRLIELLDNPPAHGKR